MRFYNNGSLLLQLPISTTDEFVTWAALLSASVTIKGSDLVFKTTAPTQQQTTLTLKEIPVYGAGKLGTYYPQEDGSVAYEITDHLGNVRALLRDHVNTYTATMEDNGADLSNPRVEELSYFSNIAETVVTDPRMNYTAANPDNGIETPSKAAYLFWQDGMTGMQAADKSVGPAIGLKVNTGDKVDIETWVRYEKKKVYTSNMTLAGLSQSLGSAFAYRAGADSGRGFPYFNITIKLASACLRTKSIAATL